MPKQRQLDLPLGTTRCERCSALFADEEMVIATYYVPWYAQPVEPSRQFEEEQATVCESCAYWIQDDVEAIASLSVAFDRLEGPEPPERSCR